MSTRTFSTGLWTTAIILLVIPAFARSQQDCGFSAFHPARISEFDRTAVHKATPEYPIKAKSKGLRGKVQIGVLVDRQGRVVKTCPVYVPGKPLPDKILLDAASAAAAEWRFMPNFGFGKEYKAPFDYVQHILMFTFVLPGNPTEVGAALERFNPSDLAGFTTSPTEHIIVPLETDFFLERIEGVIVSKTDNHPLAGALFEVRGPSEDRTVVRAKADAKGRFRLKPLRPGVYLFKATANGFQSVIGTVVVGITDNSEPMRIELPMGV